MGSDHDTLREKVEAWMRGSGTGLAAPTFTALVDLSGEGLRALDARLPEKPASTPAMQEVEVILGDIQNMLIGLNQTLGKRKVLEAEFALYAGEIIRRLCEAEDKARHGGIWSKQSAQFQTEVNTKAWGQWLNLLRAMIRNFVFLGYEYSQQWKSMPSMRIKEEHRFCLLVEGELVFKDDITNLWIFLTSIKKEKRYDNLYTIFSQMLTPMIQQLGVQVPDLHQQRNTKRKEFSELRKYDTKPRDNCATTNECKSLLRSVGGAQRPRRGVSCDRERKKP